MHPSAPDPISPPTRAPALTHVLQLWTAPASEVGSGADTCPMSHHGPWAVEIKEGFAVAACSEARVFPRYARVLLRRLQDVRVDGVIITRKSCAHALQHRAIVHHQAADRSRARWAKATTRQDGATLQTAHHVARSMGRGVPCVVRTIIALYWYLIP
jgi:hypothetical protein